MNNLWIVITTINSPTKSIEAYADIAKKMDWKLLIVGDAKTPNDYEQFDCEFLSLERQQKEYGKFSGMVPQNHYCRKNVGYLHALTNGAEWVFDTDDDNIPMEGFAESLVQKRIARIVQHKGFINAYKYFTKEPVWPRGLPLTDINQTGALDGQTQERLFSLTQFLADQEPDVDAIYRLTNDRRITFNSEETPIYLTPGAWSPTNSQATLLNSKYFHTLYLPCHVPFRMTDIWRSFVAQKMLWQDQEGIAFVAPNVVQERNPHDYFSDFKDEILGYIHNEEIRRHLEGISLGDKPHAEQLVECYSQFKTVGVVEDREFEIIREWNSMIERIIN